VVIVRVIGLGKTSSISTEPCLLRVDTLPPDRGGLLPDWLGVLNLSGRGGGGMSGGDGMSGGE